MKKTQPESKTLLQKNSIRILLLASVFIVPLIIILFDLQRGYLMLWSDPARDLLAAWANLQKPTLIGPTSGIPGIFYGPYWIWLLSLGQIFSKDPIIITFVTATLPYLILFPIIWFKFAKYFGLKATVLGWLFFIFGTGLSYTTQLWNLYPAPLLALGVLYTLFINDIKEFLKRSILLCTLTGFLLGLVINFHISFGIGFTAGVALYLLISTITDCFKAKTNVLKMIRIKLVSIIAIVLGFITAYIPTLLFEVRHGFNQTQTLLNALSQYGAVVDVKGLSKEQILQKFIETFGALLHLDSSTAGSILAVLVILFVLLVKTKRIVLTQTDKRFLTLIVSVLSGIAFIYFTARNPIWEYHFVGVDILFLLLLTFFLAKIRFLYFAGILGITAIILSTYHLYFVTDLKVGGLIDFYARKTAVEQIIADANDNDYAVYTYSSSIYTYEYSYMFLWLDNKEVPVDPSLIVPQKMLYLIVPSKKDAYVEDFMNSRAPEKKYNTVKSWEFGKDVRVIKKLQK